MLQNVYLKLGNQSSLQEKKISFLHLVAFPRYEDNVLGNNYKEIKFLKLSLLPEILTLTSYKFRNKNCHFHFTDECMKSEMN